MQPLVCGVAKKNMEMDTKMTLGNCNRIKNDLIIQPDMAGDDNYYIAFSITIDGDHIPLSDNDCSETYFHINKAQAKVLISYLQSLVDDM